MVTAFSYRIIIQARQHFNSVAFTSSSLTMAIESLPVYNRLNLKTGKR